MVDVVELQDYIIANPHYIQCVLEELGHTHIRDKGKYYSARNIGGDNNNGLSVLKSTLHVESYSRGWSTSLVGLVEDEKNVSFKEALELIAGWIGFKGSSYKKKNIKKPFGGFYSNIIADTTDSQIALPTYGEDILPPPGALPYLWVKDGCSLKELERFRISLDFDTNKIVIPARNAAGDLVGAKARINSNKVDLDKRWSMFKPYSKSLILFGYSENYSDIINKKTVLVAEAEKSTIISASMDLKCCTAIGGHNISDIQAKYIKSFFADKIIVAFDEGISEEEVVWNCEKLKGNIFYKPKIGYVYDRDNIILKKGSKQSPFDRGSEVLKILLQEPFLHWL